MKTHYKTIDFLTERIKRAEGEGVIRIELSDDLFTNTDRPYRKGDIVHLQKVDAIPILPEARFYLVHKELQQSICFCTIKESKGFYSVCPEHLKKAQRFNKDIFFDMVDVYEILYISRPLN